MPCDAPTIMAGAIASGYGGLEGRSLLLAMAGALSSTTGLTATQAMVGAATSGYYGLEDRDIEEAFLAVLCPTVPVVAPPIVLSSITNTITWSGGGVDTFGWLVQFSPDNVAWSNFSTTNSGVTSINIENTGQKYWRVVLGNGTGDPVLPYSNVIFVNQEPS